MDCKELEDIIYGRIEPHIYAFNTNDIPNYLKIGDTYRPVKIRLKEWQHVFPKLEQQFEGSATVTDDIYFRDYSIHQFLEREKQKHRLTEDDLKKINSGCSHYSNEFFENTNNKDVEDAIADIKKEYKKSEKYSYYSTKDKVSLDFVYQRTDVVWKPRPNQEEAIENFYNAYINGRNNLLMYAVMRFGKSFTSICCADKINSKFVVVVSAKADVKTEWKKTVEIPANFKDYKFIESKDLNENDNIIKEILEEGKKIVCFLTLQDLQGEILKTKHTQVFNTPIDLLIIDETHFGARAESYGKVLVSDPNYQKDSSLSKIRGEDDYSEIKVAEETIKTLSNAKVKLHLSGTPYRILMSSEFEKDDIISFCQFSDIVHEQEEWDCKNIKNGEPQKEWENPYFGFPQMIRFAFNPNESVRVKLSEFKNHQLTYAFSALFKPKSIVKDEVNNLHKKFEYEKEILDLLEVIDGTKEDNELFGFLDYEKIKKGKMCRHMVAVLPYCATCDALENLIISNKEKFKNLNSYKIINISGVENNLYKKIEDVKGAINEAEKENTKTLTLTVNRMLTGSTVEQWDTMLYFKDTSSPQEYDQAIFRLQNQYIKTLVDEKTGDEIKYNLKPQTLLVDFDPMRLFSMQEIKSKIYNANTDESGNSKLENRLKEELRISPIITNNKNRLVQVTPIDILHAISEYSRNKGVAEETIEIPIDYKLFNIEEIREEIEKQGELGSRNGFTVTGASGEGTDLDLGDFDDDLDSGDDIGNNPPPSGDEESLANPITSPEDEIESMIKKWRTYYARILFFAFLTKNKVISLQQIIEISDEEDNFRIISNLDLNKTVLVLMQANMDKFGLSQLDYKIQNINNLANDVSVEPLERAMTALKKFGRLSESEIVTPSHICDDMIALLPEEVLTNCLSENKCFLDINSKLAEFAISIFKRYTEKMRIDKNRFKNLIYAIPSSKYTYEFTRKIYEILGLNIDNIAQNFVSYDLLAIKDSSGIINYKKIRNFLNQEQKFSKIKLTSEENIKDTTDGDNYMKFDVVVGNPPYQSETKQKSESNGQKPRTNIFQYFQIVSSIITNNVSVLIYPGKRWLHYSGKGCKDFGYEQINSPSLKHLIFYPNASDVFERSQISDGITIVYRDNNKKQEGFTYDYVTNNGSITLELAPPKDDLFILNPKDIKIISKIKAYVKKAKISYLNDAILPRSLFGIESDFVEKNKESVEEYFEGMSIDYSEKVKILANDKAGPAGRTMWFVIDKTLIPRSKELINEYQVVVSSAHPGGQEGRDNQLSIADNHSAFGRSRIALRTFKTKREAQNFMTYISTNIMKYLLLMSDEALTSLAKFVPDIQDYSDSNKIIDFSRNVEKQLLDLLKLKKSEIDYINTII